MCASGATVRAVARYRPKAAIIAVTNDEALSGKVRYFIVPYLPRTQLMLGFGVIPVLSPETDWQRTLQHVTEFAHHLGVLEPGDNYVLIGAHPTGSFVEFRHFQ